MNKILINIFNDLDNSLNCGGRITSLDNRYVELDSFNNVILFKKQGSDLAYSISLCLNKKVNELYCYINLVKLSNIGVFNKIISVGNRLPVVQIEHGIEISLSYRLLKELEEIQSLF